MNPTENQPTALAALIAPYLPAAIARYGSLESAVDHTVALMAADDEKAENAAWIAKVTRYHAQTLIWRDDK